MPDADRSFTFFLHFRKPTVAAITFLTLSVAISFAQVLEHKTPTERLIKRYEKLVAEGALLSPDGWARASKLFNQPGPYPAQSAIELISVPGLIGETKLDGDRAQVETKWGDSYGTIDSQLRFRSVGYGGSVMMGEFFSLAFVHHPESPKEDTASDSGEWKIEKAPLLRSASIPAAIKYLEAMRDVSKDPILRKNAEKSIHALKHLTSGCGIPNPC
jgi:hypothetical protein